MSTEQFDYVLGLVEPHISRLLTVYVAVYVQGRTTQYDVVCSVNAEVVNAPTVNPCPGNGFFATFTGNGGGVKIPPGISRVLEHIARKFQRLPLTRFSSGTADVIGHRCVP